MPRDEELYLQDILASISRLRRYVAGHARQEFLADELLQDGIVMRLAIIGEAVAHLSSDVRAQHPTVPWRSIVAFRNVSIHGYFSLNLDTVWTTATEQLDDLEAVIAAILNRTNLPTPSDEVK